MACLAGGAFFFVSTFFGGGAVFVGFFAGAFLGGGDGVGDGRRAFARVALPVLVGGAGAALVATGAADLGLVKTYPFFGFGFFFGGFFGFLVAFGTGFAFPAIVAADLDLALGGSGETLVFLAGGGGDLAALPRPRFCAAGAFDSSSSFYCLLVLIFYKKGAMIILLLLSIAGVFGNPDSSRIQLIHDKEIKVIWYTSNN